MLPTFQKPIHSHNDYWRDIPFYSALSHGCISIEADVWLINSTLYVGHEPSALTSTRTLSSLYVQPILSVLSRLNPTTPFSALNSRPNGVFDTSSTQTLYLFIDIKTDGEETWPAVVSALEPLRSANYLTTYNSTTRSITHGPVTIIGTGNAPLSSFLALDSPRDFFYDAPINLLTTNPSPSEEITSLTSLTSSTSFLSSIGYPAYGSSGFSESQLEKIQSQIKAAKDKGIGMRYWDTPAWPLGVRNLIWRTLTDFGVFLLNADGLGEAAGEEEGGGVW
ncbi:putative alkaline phosphatase [Phaeomoniella chlamydospora]|uniref:Putative alkaline phosphatase n=1 Tax=Phaeomoniella chlamydospora TaxID=158046 RepID=A0A0G2GNJ7_PHACM|nr:putative alkaline phosphatase [Phaeomoniella chlamydospora]